MIERILRAAQARFEKHGISATTMGELAQDAGISRAWLYRHYPNREAVVEAVVARQTQQLVSEVVQAADPALSPEQRLTEAFVRVVRTLRANPMLRRLLADDREIIAPYLMGDAAPLLRSGIELLAGALAGTLKPAQARRVAETVIRLVFSIAVVPALGVDFDNPRELRAYAAQVIPSLLAATQR